MDGERISLRLESEDLKILDEFIEIHPEYSNRSNLARVAIREFIENSDKPKSRTNTSKGDEISLVLPPAIYDVFYNMVEGGYFHTVGDALMYYARVAYDEVVEAARMESIKNVTKSGPFQVIDK